MKENGIPMEANGSQTPGNCVANLKPLMQKKVAIVGAGAAGLACAKELREEGHIVKIFEEGSSVGGTWVLNDTAASSLHGDADGLVAHSSMYDCLRTNLPRELMSFTGLPFTPECMGGRSHDSRRYPGHTEVRAYMDAYADAFNLRPFIHFRNRVTKVEVRENTNGKKGRQWLVGTNKQEDWFDSVAVCNGHYSKPVIPSIEGSQTFPGHQMHSHNYRNSKGLDNKVVVVVGTAASGSEISRDVAEVAETVYLSGRSQDNAYAMDGDRWVGLKKNICKMAEIIKLGDKGEVWFKDGEHLPRVDAIVYCTGYDYMFPFLDAALGVTISTRRVSPLYQQIFVPEFGTDLSFVGVPFQIVPFPFFEYQSRYIARVLSGRVALPSREEMEKDTETYMRDLLEAGFEIRHTHLMRNSQFAYVDWLAEQCGPDCKGYSPWRREMFDDGFRRRKFNPEAFRDVWEDYDSIAAAQEDFAEAYKRVKNTPKVQHAHKACAVAEHLPVTNVVCELDA